MTGCIPTGRRWFLRQLCGALTVVGGGIRQAAATETEVLVGRVGGYWKARRDADLSTAYDFYAPSFRRRYTRAEFLTNFQRLLRFPLQSFAVEDLTMMQGGQAARVRVRLSIRQDFYGTELHLDSFAEDEWVLEDGAWWKRDEPFVLNV